MRACVAAEAEKRRQVMGHTVTLACCALNQWALDFHGNIQRILESVRLAKEKGAAYRLGPELEVCGYGCGDHFLEVDTQLLCLQSLARILEDPGTGDIICDVGMPVMHKNVLYNCRVIFLNQTILLIRPKMFLAMDGNYREMRWFTPWTKVRRVEQFCLPPLLAGITGQVKVPFGDAVISTGDTVLGCETCEELFTGNSPHIAMGLDGVEIFTNGSGSHHELRKLHKRVGLIQSATSKVGGVYMYSNLIGCDGERVFYDGCCLIAVNGDIVAQGSQFTLREVEVTTATVDLDDVRSFRGSCLSRGMQTALAAPYPQVSAGVSVSHPSSLSLPVSQPLSVKYLMPEEEISLGPACWLWDYLRRSRLCGFFLPLSGGLDSASVACLVGSMCQLVVDAIAEGCGHVAKDLQQLLGKQEGEGLPKSAKDLAKLIFTTCYMKTANSSADTETRAARLAAEIGSTHISVSIDNMVSAAVETVTKEIKATPKFKVRGGTSAEDMALQNVQARNRMVLSYLFAQLLPWSHGNHGNLLVLSSANVDESLRGYLTKYDCSSADLNPIGGISKTDLRSFCKYMTQRYPQLKSILAAKPTAELEPITSSHVQNDEDDMGMTYSELSVFGRLRKVYHCGPYSMFLKLIHMWGDRLTPAEVAEKVKHFFRCYGINRHKMTVLPPSYHAEVYSPDDNRYDLRPFLYNPTWQSQFEMIDRELVVMETGLTSEHSSVVGGKQVLSISTDVAVKGDEESVQAEEEEEDDDVMENEVAEEVSGEVKEGEEEEEEEGDEEEEGYKGWKRTTSEGDEQFVTAAQKLPFEDHEDEKEGQGDDLVVIDETVENGSKEGRGRGRGRGKRRRWKKNKEQPKERETGNISGSGGGRGGNTGARGRGGGRGRGGKGKGKKRLNAGQRQQPKGTPHPLAGRGGWRGTSASRRNSWTPRGSHDRGSWHSAQSLNSLLQTPSSLVAVHDRPSPFSRLGPDQFSTPQRTPPFSSAHHDPSSSYSHLALSSYSNLPSHSQFHSASSFSQLPLASRDYNHTPLSLSAEERDIVARQQAPPLPSLSPASWFNRLLHRR